MGKDIMSIIFGENVRRTFGYSGHFYVMLDIYMRIF